MSVGKLKYLPNIHQFKWIKSRKLITASAAKDVGQEKFSLFMRPRNPTATLRNSLLVSFQLRTLLTYDPTVVVCSFYPKALKTHPLKDLCVVSISVLFIIAKPWKDSTCPSMSDWRNPAKRKQ